MVGKKRKIIFVLLAVSLISILLVSSAYAFSWAGFWASIITGRAITGNAVGDSVNFNQSQLVGLYSAYVGKTNLKGQSFKFPNEVYATKACVQFKYSTGTKQDIKVSITSALQTSPFTPQEYLTSFTINPSEVNSSQNKFCKDFEKPVLLSANTHYDLVLESKDSSAVTTYHSLYKNSNLYPNGAMIYSSNNGATWNTYSSYDLYFEVFGSDKTDETKQQSVTCVAGQKIGDASGDGDITSYDASLVGSVAVGNIPLPSDLCCVDVNKDGKVDISDSILISNIAAGNSQSPGVCEEGDYFIFSMNYSFIYPPSSSIGDVYTTAEDLCNAIVGVKVIYALVEDSWSGHVCGSPLYNFNLKKGQGYYFSATNSSSFNLKGYQEEDILISMRFIGDYSTNLNQIMLPDNWDNKKAEDLCKAIPTAASIIKRENGYYDYHPCGRVDITNFDLESKKVYTIDILADTVWNPKLDIQTCTDSDGGLNYYVKGTVNSSIGNIVETDRCITSEGSGYNLEERFCNSDINNGQIGLASTQLYNCLYGCSDGACVQPFKFGSSGSKTIQLTTTLKSGLAQIEILSGDGVSFNNIGGEIGEYKNLVVTTGVNYIIFDRDTDYAFVASSTMEDAEESYYLTVSSISKLNAGADNYTTIKDIVTGADAGTCVKVHNSASCQIGNVVLQLSNVDADAKTVKITGSKSISFDRIYNTLGEFYYLPYKAQLPTKEYIATVYESVTGGHDKQYKFYWQNGNAYVSEIIPTENETCSGLIDKVKNPISFTAQDRTFNAGWSDSQRTTVWIDGNNYPADYYYAYWYSYASGEKYYSLSYSLNVLDDKSVDLDAWIEERTRYEVCAPQDYWINDKPQRVYICNWDVLNQEQNVGSSSEYTSKQILWTNDNVLVNVNLWEEKQLTDEEIQEIAQESINNFLDDLRNNQYEYISWENFDLGYVIQSVINSDLQKCPSEINASACTPSWECKVEPVICPPHGYQTKICVDYRCGTPDVTTTQSCTPGICAGCMNPRWVGGDDNICIPYGTRFSNEEFGWSHQIIEGYDEYKNSLLEISNENSAILTTYGKYENYTNYLHKGSIVYIYYPNWQESTKVKVENIVPATGDSVGYVEVSDAYEYNAFCNYNGQVQYQKYSGSYCQNDYECMSGVCSNQKCGTPCSSGCLSSPWIEEPYKSGGSSGGTSSGGGSTSSGGSSGSGGSVAIPINYQQTCIPVGTRITQKSSYSGSIKEGSDYDISLEIPSATEAVLTLYGLNGEKVTYKMVAGGTYQLSVPGYTETINFRLDEIVYNSKIDENVLSYITFTSTEARSSYCSYQSYFKPLVSDNSECNNNYECTSNECRNGKCVNTYEEASFTRRIIIRGLNIWCRILHPTNDAQYNQCKVYFGEKYGEEAPYLEPKNNTELSMDD
jgi:hypothetical protein